MYLQMESPGAETGAENSKALPGRSERLKCNVSETKQQAARQQRRAAKVRAIRAHGRPHLTRERVQELLSYDPETGEFRHRTGRGGRRSGDIAGTIDPNGYRLIFIDYFQWRASRLAWLLMTGAFPPPGILIDHRDGNRANDVWANLRLATYAENARNRGPGRNNTTGKVGVHPIGDRLFGAEICINGRSVNLGRFECLEDAIAARCEAEKHHFGSFRRDVAEYQGGGYGGA